MFSIRIDVYHHLGNAASAELAQVLSLVRQISRRQEEIAMSGEDVNAQILAKAQSIETKVSNVAGDVTSLKEQLAAAIANGQGTGLTHDQAVAILDKLSGIEGSLTTLDDSTPGTPPTP